ncbi:ABC transporter permease [Cohnella soli]|uniref:Transport permease protein n=1 Tax=Cohnella soli TaxID=425005 RepID=A0ABW0HPZ0_9BACL
MTTRQTAIKPVSLLTTNTILLGRSIRLSIRNIEALMTSIMLPIMLMLLFTYVFGGALDPTGNYVDYVVPGIILLCAGFGSSSTAVSVADDMSNGIIDRFRTMPLRSLSVITGHVVANVIRNLCTTGIVIGVALLVGFRPSGSFLEWLGAIGIITLFIVSFTWLFAAIGSATRNPAAASGYGFILLFLPYLSSAFVPTHTMPAWLRGVADNQPITPVIETIRGLLTGTPIHNSAWLSIAWCAVIALASIVWCMYSFNRKAGRR